MSHIVTSRFVSCLNVLKENNVVPSYRGFALSVDFSPQSLNEILRGKRNVTIDLIAQSVEKYNLNAQYLYSGVGEKFVNQEDEIIQHNTEVKELPSISYVPIAAQAGYGCQIQDVVLEHELPSFTLPGYEHKTGDHRCFDIAGDSMEPSLYSGDKVVCSKVEMEYWMTKVKSGLVFIIVTADSLFVKRINNNLRTHKSIELVSDNSFYEPFDVPANELREIWQVDLTMSAFNASPKCVKNGVYDQVEELKDMLTNQTETIKNLNNTISILCKSNRTLN